MKESIKQFFYLLDPQAKKAIPYLIGIFILSSCLDVIGIGLIGVFLGILSDPDFFFHKFPYMKVLLQGISEKKIIIYAGIFTVSAFLLKAVITLIIQTKVVFFCQSLSVRLKARLMRAYQHAPYSYYLQKNSAHQISVIQVNVGSYVNSMLLAMLNLISSAIISSFILLLLLILHPFSTLFLVFMFAIAGFGYDLVSKRSLSSLGKVVAYLNGEITKNINEGLHGLVEIRVLGKEEFFLGSINKDSRQYAHATGVLIALQQVPRYLIENIIAIFIVCLSVGGITAGFDKASVLAMIGIFGAAGARLLPTINQIITSISQVRGSSGSMQSIYNDLQELETLNRKMLKRTIQATKEEKLSFLDIHLNQVSYKYDNANYPALENIDIKITKGQSIGLIGPSGAGKSTLINLILSFIEPQKGQLLVDGKIIENARAWLNNFAYIPQTIFLLDDTFRRNIALGVEDKEIDEQRIMKAIQMAQLTEVVNQLPNKLETMIGENGVRLSGGQRQRVALARAFYHERDIIIMDEATSSLDNETEKEVINTIKRLKGNKTLIVIAHRLTTVEHCDILYRLEKGQVSAVGSYEEVVGVIS